jgi:phosphonate transport system substrate-binding protein
MRILKLVVLLLVGCLLIAPFSQAEGDHYVFAVVPQTAATDIHNQWAPFLERLSKDLGITLELRTYPSITEFAKAVLKGSPDFAYMNPYQAMMAKQYVPLIRDKNHLVGILVVHKGKGINSIRDLNGKTIAFPDPNAYAASLYLRALLSQKEKIQFTPIYVKNHSNVYRTVALDKAAAGGGVPKTLTKEPETLRERLTVLYETPGSVSHPISAHSRIPETLQEKMKSAILRLATDPANKELFKNVQITEPVAAEYRDYLPLALLRLEKYTQ